MATNIAGDQSRQQHTQVTNTIRRQVNFNDAQAATGIAMGQIPQGAFITRVLCEITTVFNGGTTNVLTVGTNVAMDNIIAAGDVNEAALAVTDVTRGLGRSLTALAPTTISAKFVSTGTAPTTGQAEIVIEYEANTG